MGAIFHNAAPGNALTGLQTVTINPALTLERAETGMQIRSHWQ